MINEKERNKFSRENFWKRIVLEHLQRGEKNPSILADFILAEFDERFPAPEEEEEEEKEPERAFEEFWKVCLECGEEAAQRIYLTEKYIGIYDNQTPGHGNISHWNCKNCRHTWPEFYKPITEESEDDNGKKSQTEETQSDQENH